MGYEIKQMWARRDRYTAGGNSKKYIVVHNTASTASAYAEARNLHNNPGRSSFHYTLDGEDIYQCVHDYDTAWAVGKWSGTVAYIRNNESISIEVCSPGTEFTQAEKDQLRCLVHDLMSAYGIPASRVVRHWDCHSGRKECPKFYAGSNNAAWTKLHAYITSGEEDEVTSEDIAKIAQEVWNYEIGSEGRMHYNNTPAWQHLSFAHYDTARLYQGMTDTSDPTGRDVKMDDHDHIKWLAAGQAKQNEVLDSIVETLASIKGEVESLKAGESAAE